MSVGTEVIQTAKQDTTVKKPTGHFYIAKLACGCVCASAVDSEEARQHIADDVAEWIRTGLSIERVTREEWRANVADNFGKCPHGTLKERQAAFVARRDIPLHKRLTEIAIAWLKKNNAYENDDDSIANDVKEAVDGATGDKDAFKICNELQRKWWDVDMDLCSKFDHEISLTER